MSGSGLFQKQHADKAHLLQGGGLAAEVKDLRDDILEEMGPVAAITIEEFTNPGASTAVNLKAATATTVAPQTILAAALLAPGLAILAAAPRNLIFTTADGSGVAADAPPSAVITGKGPKGEAQTETVTIAQTNAGLATGVKLWTAITSVAYAAADGTGATVAIGVGKAMYLPKTPKVRAGLAALVREIAAGALVTTGAIDAVNKSYTPATAQNGTNDYAAYYEYDPLV